MAEKSTRWSFTAYEAQYPVLETLDKDIVAEVGWQDEVCPDTQRKHRQGYVRTHRQVRFSQLKKVMPGIHLEIARDWNALLAYCRKTESRDISGSQIHKDFSKYAPERLHELMDEMASYAILDTKITNKDRQTDRQTILGLDANEQYWSIVPTILSRKPELIGILAQPLPQNAWKHTRMFWIERRWDAEGYEQ